MCWTTVWGRKEDVVLASIPFLNPHFRLVPLHDAVEEVEAGTRAGIVQFTYI